MLIAVERTETEVSAVVQRCLCSRSKFDAEAVLAAKGAEADNSVVDNEVAVVASLNVAA